MRKGEIEKRILRIARRQRGRVPSVTAIYLDGMRFSVLNQIGVICRVPPPFSERIVIGDYSDLFGQRSVSDSGYVTSFES